MYTTELICHTLMTELTPAGNYQGSRDDVRLFLIFFCKMEGLQSVPKVPGMQELEKKHSLCKCPDVAIHLFVTGVFPRLHLC